jgi:hypothetical protein
MRNGIVTFFQAARYYLKDLFIIIIPCEDPAPLPTSRHQYELALEDSVARNLAKIQALAVRRETRSQKAQRLYDEYLNAQSKEAIVEAAQTLVEFKRSVKLGWPSLGIQKWEGAVVLRHTA